MTDDAATPEPRTAATTATVAFGALLHRLEEVWIRVGDPEVRAITDGLYVWFENAEAQARPAVASEGLRERVAEAITHGDMVGWPEARMLLKAALASDAGSVGALDGTTVVRLLHSVGNTLAGWVRHMDGYGDDALAKAFDFVIRYPDPQERIAAARLDAERQGEQA